MFFMNKKTIVIAVGLLVFLAVGSAFAQSVCTVLAADGTKTTDTIEVRVSSFDNTTGKVGIVVSSDSDKPVNATITIYVDGTSKYSGSVRIEPFQSGIKNFTLSSWTKKNASVTVSISGAKCLR
jgi:hypothetical protein